MKNPEARRRIRRNQKQRAIRQIQALQGELYQRFPHAFWHEPDKVTPLKKGIYHDIRAALTDRTYNTRVIGWTLRRYTQRHAYLRALAMRKPRIDLSGEVVDTVTEEEQQQAIAQLKTMRRRRGKPRQANEAKEQVEGSLLTSNPSGGVITEVKHQPAPVRQQTMSNRRRQSGEVGKTKEEGREKPQVGDDA